VPAPGSGLVGDNVVHGFAAVAACLAFSLVCCLAFACSLQLLLKFVAAAVYIIIIGGGGCLLSLVLAQELALQSDVAAASDPFPFCLKPSISLLLLLTACFLG
jgi:hypothetical protein